MFNIERWKTIKDFPRYKISSKGRVKSYWVNEKNGRIMNWKYAGISRNKKPMINLRKNMRTYNKMIHKLVAEAFIRNPKPDIYNCVAYKDHNCMNILPNNLYWTNKSELAKKAFKKAGHPSLVHYRWEKHRLWGKVSERFKELVLKTSIPKGITGSNPVLSAV